MAAENKPDALLTFDNPSEPDEAGLRLAPQRVRCVAGTRSSDRSACATATVRVEPVGTVRSEGRFSEMRLEV